MDLVSYGSKEEPVVDDEELGSEGADLVRIERVYRYANTAHLITNSTDNI